nr:splicing factor [Tanacetum cinerariifolium]
MDLPVNEAPKNCTIKESRVQDPDPKPTIPTQESQVQTRSKIRKQVATATSLRIYVKNRSRSKRIANIKEKNFKFDANGSGSTADKSFDVEGRLLEFKNQEIKFCEKIRVLEFNIEGKTNRIEYLTKELENLKNEKKGLESKLTVLFPPHAQVYSPLKKDMSWTGLPEFADDIITDYTRSSPSVESNPNDLQNSSSSASENGESTGSILSKPEIKFIKPADSPTVAKTNKVETVRKSTIKYAELYIKTSKRSNVRGNQRN